MKKFIVLTLVLGLVSSSWATVLDFDVNGIANDTAFMNVADPTLENEYGSYVDAAGTRSEYFPAIAGSLDSTYSEGDTPNIRAMYFGSAKYYDLGAGDLVGVQYTADPSSWYMGFSPDPGYEVVIESFDLAAWGAITVDVQIWNYPISGGSYGVLWEQTGVAVPDTGHVTVTPNFTGTDSDQGYYIVLSAGGSGIGIDNINISQTPEPATIALLGMGALALIRKRR